jgi:hypothetical protein
MNITKEQANSVKKSVLDYMGKGSKGSKKSSK